MARLFQSLRRALGLTPSKPVPKFSGSIDTNFSYFREGDRVVVHGKTPSLTKPLRRGQKTDVRRGVLEHDSIIGQRVRDLVKAHKGPDYRLSLPTLDEYVSMTPRLVTPIYSADANLIVSLLDIHVTPPAEGSQEQPPLEILESGTGHGSLTLHLARAIQAANSVPPRLPPKSQIQYLQGRPIRPGTDAEKADPKSTGNTAQELPDGFVEQQTEQQQWDAWRAHRRAIIHTVDVSPKFSAHAEKIVRGFRRGIYAGNVDFYVGHVENWIAEQKKARASRSLLSSSPTVEPFLSYAILDMPSAHLRIPHVAPILKRDGILVVFMPSVTQVGDCVDLIRRQKLPFILEKVVELGSGISSGRLWDVRFAVKKSRADPSSWTEAADSAETEEDSSDAAVESVPAAPEEAARQEDSVLVCRPKVGTRIVGGGFVGVWRRIEDSSKE
ncbi:tRNA (adenine-N(1)-)-methyltransferase [Aspergillus fischeri NRRL 181]|uniref:tRNA (adenine(58)-N(1))-methyltransferase catalytic subunit TRM61 n=1 Tax=Neosartorya fischeri (strain ATCC 1020 / DSM 3700 / CBS 544.65 / FGSC A1164 / JCM 1740 / NRRL 181 / WB 181) TaxID=331117 RepID=A1CW68_NEOFI|nr:tRNA (adenine-N(1)-)-methyltransferase [Aspergillus fischeri NRRL 181]EAW24870.1 tRNA (adenine-N(1)-)-methyltransferase [Aspergillus fischeri NRRL 181]KAG2027343.1 hypothetical protein GB937_001084 [Aspergillus fischeri]